MKAFSTAILTTLLLGIVAHGQLAPTAPPPEKRSIEIDGYAAKVNDKVITQGEVREALAPLLPDLYRAYKGEQLEKELDSAYRKAREDLVDRALILAAFKKRGGQIPDQYVNEEIDRMVKARFNGDKAVFEQTLAAQKKTLDEYKETIRDQLAVGMMINEEITKRVRITPEQVRKAYEDHLENYAIPEKVKYSVIVLNKGTTPEEQAVKLKEARSIRKQLLAGADFNETAKKVSEGSRSAEGGAFPWMQPKDARPELRETLHTLPAGKISEIIPTDTQLYIVKVEARRQAGHKSFDEVRQAIKASLAAEERERLKKRWIERLKKENYVVYYND